MFFFYSMWSEGTVKTVFFFFKWLSNVDLENNVMTHNAKKDPNSRLCLWKYYLFHPIAFKHSSTCSNLFVICKWHWFFREDSKTTTRNGKRAAGYYQWVTYTPLLCIFSSRFMTALLHIKTMLFLRLQDGEREGDDDGGRLHREQLEGGGHNGTGYEHHRSSADRGGQQPTQNAGFHHAAKMEHAWEGTSDGSSSPFSTNPRRERRRHSETQFPVGRQLRLLRGL